MLIAVTVLGTAQALIIITAVIMVISQLLISIVLVMIHAVQTWVEPVILVSIVLEIGGGPALTQEPGAGLLMLGN